MSVTPQGVPNQGVPQGLPDQGVQGVPQGEPTKGVPIQGASSQGVPDRGPRGATPTRIAADTQPLHARRAAAAPSALPDAPPGSVAASVTPAQAATTAPAAPAASPPRRRLPRAALILLLLALGLLIGFGVFVRAALDPARPLPEGTDGIVVLTGGSERVATGFRQLAEGQARRLLISGAHPEASLAEIAAAAGIDAAPFAGRVAVGHAAASTRGNAAEAAAWARAEQMQSLRIVTAGYHMPRAMVELRRAMPALRLVEHPVPSAALRAPGALRRPQIWALLAGEYARYLGAWVGLSGAFVPRRETAPT